MIFFCEQTESHVAFGRKHALYRNIQNGIWYIVVAIDRGANCRIRSHKFYFEEKIGEI